MPLFTSKEKSYLGIDIGKGSIKVVELLNDNGRARLVTYGYVNRETEEIPEKDLIDYPKETGEIIKKICARAKTRSTRAIAAIPVFSVFSSVLNLTDITAKELGNKKALGSRVEWEAKKIIPLPLEEMILDWKIINENGVKGKLAEKEENKESNKNIEEEPVIKEKLSGVQVLLTAAPRKLVEKYIAIFKTAGLQLLSLETEAFALVRSLVGRDKSPMIILDSGAGRSNLSIVDNGIPFINRSIDIGGAVITKALSQKLGVDLGKAEQFKLDLAQGAVDPKIYEAIAATLNPLINEIRYSLNIYKSQEGEKAKDIEKIILAGGSSLLFDFPGYLSRALNMRIYIGDPWSRVIYPEELKPLLEEIGPRFAVPIGLAMRDIY
ncbi:MAG: pilus assembly protein PilM [Patescibacteria group bacterium]|nr:pilus assembly protein PilM [Patescibacteria group bacterium]MDD5490670.1 pilus assembly protein PilM [Patescibacteria group bacterium]